MHSKDSIHQESNASFQLKRLTSLGIKDLGITLSSKRRETERHISFKHEAVKQEEATGLQA
jgi:hypothetical protein